MIARSRVLVTGGAGFLGSHLSTRLVEEGAEVTVLDNLSAGNLQRLQNVASCENFHFFKGDIRNTEDVKQSVKDKDIILHFAAKVGVIRAASQGIDVLDTTLKGISLLLAESTKCDVKTFVYASSSEVYGEPSRLPSREDDPLIPRSTYAVAKVAAERYCEEYGTLYGIDTCIFRYFNVYGPRQNDNFVIPQFLHHALRGEALPVYGSGAQTRDFCYIDDAVSLTLEGMKWNKGFNIFNVGSGEPISLKRLAELVSSLSAKECSIAFVDLDTRRPQEYEIIHRQADISKIVSLCGVSPKHSLEDGLRTCLEALM
ncbi:MAG: SDR family NAD(P)-dependent oxidoreductase [Theionarchaea archaeon]|nr:SDR family NAD(P)-dependent oxidoreductase [Theionarchaea archaeon]MBU7038684.1 SDR family NAD(P)-dependent oxidoreductase [Theionarchaea archaeon]